MGTYFHYSAKDLYSMNFQAHPAVFDDETGSLGSNQQLTLSACMNINSGQTGPLFAGKTMQDLLLPTPNTTGDNRVLPGTQPFPQSK